VHEKVSRAKPFLNLQKTRYLGKHGGVNALLRKEKKKTIEKKGSGNHRGDKKEIKGIDRL